MSIKTVIFDFDGTLVDSAPIIQILINDMRKELGFLPLSAETYAPWMSLGGTTLIKNALKIKEPDLIKSNLIEFRSRYLKLPGTASPLFNNVKNSLKLLRENNIQIALCTNKPQMLVDKILNDWEITNYFDFITTGKDDATDKPNPKKLLTCIEMLNNNLNESIFVGDAQLDKTTADNANIKFALHRDGYNDGVDETSCDLVFDGYFEFTEKVLKYE